MISEALERARKLTDMRLAIVRSSISTVTPEILRQFDGISPAPFDIRLNTTPSGGFEFENFRTWDEFYGAFRAYRPDALLTINQLGSDDTTPITALCELERVPVIRYYVDNPMFSSTVKIETEMDCILPVVNSPAWVKGLKDFGFRNVEFMPMGTDPTHFRMPEEEDRDIPISFVGDLGGNRGAEIFQSLKSKLGGVGTLFEPELKELIEDGAKWLIENPDKFPDQYLDTFEKSDGFVYHFTRWPITRKLLAILIDIRATLIKRVEYVKALLPLGIQVWGGNDWLRYIPQDHFNGPISYHEVQKVYQRSKIVLNVSKYQSMAVADQRHMDVPACGALLFSEENRTQIETSPGHVSYSGKDELVSLAEEYLGNEEVRALMVLGSSGAVHNEHTYMHRVDQIADMVKAHRARMRKPINPEIRKKLAAKWVQPMMEGGSPEVAEALAGKNPEPRTWEIINAYKAPTDKKAEIVWDQLPEGLVAA